MNNASPDERRQSKPRPMFSFIGIENRVASALIALVAIGLVLCCLIPAFMPAVGSRPPSKRTQCKNNLKQIALALHNYHDVYGSFPPAYIADKDGRPMHSWRVLLLPYI